MASCGLQRGVFVVFLLVFGSALVSSVFFHIAEGEQRCFIQEISNGSTVIGDYWTRLYNEGDDEYLQLQDFNLSLAVEAPNSKMVLTQWDGSEGRFNFTASASGQHKICLQPGSSQRPLLAGHVLAVHVDIGSAERTKDTKIQTMNRLTGLQLRVRQLADQVEQIQKELDYQRSLEEDFFSITYSTNMWIFWWPILRAVYVVVFVIGFTSSW